MRARVEAGRARAALAIVAAMIVAVPAADVVSRWPVAEGRPDAVTAGGIDAASIFSEGNAESALGRISKLADTGQAALPEAFESEVGLPEGARDVRVDATGRVVGFLLDGAEDAVLSLVVREMGLRGWSAVPLGEGAVGATFVKDEGNCRWVLVTCNQVGGETCVVMRGWFA